MAEIKILGSMKWFRVAEQPDGLDHLPHAFHRAKSLWEEDPVRYAKEITKSLAPFIGGTFVADNISGWQDFFNGETFGEFQALEVRPIGFDFKDSPLPLCKVEAIFEIPLCEGVSENDVVKWSDEILQGDLYTAIIFYWDLYDIDELADLDLSVGDHSGCEASILQATYSKKI